MAGFASSCCRRNGSPCIHLRKTSRNKFVTTEQKKKNKEHGKFSFHHGWICVKLLLLWKEWVAMHPFEENGHVSLLQLNKKDKTKNMVR